MCIKLIIELVESNLLYWEQLRRTRHFKIGCGDELLHIMFESKKKILKKDEKINFI
jgi:hypothetical protein